MNGHELRAIGKVASALHLVDHLGHAFHHIIPLQNRCAEAHQLGDRLSVPGAFQNLIRDDRDRLGIVQLYPSL